jgi:hypothetical protein
MFVNIWTCRLGIFCNSAIYERLSEARTWLEFESFEKSRGSWTFIKTDNLFDCLAKFWIWFSSTGDRHPEKVKTYRERVIYHCHSNPVCSKSGKVHVIGTHMSKNIGCVLWGFTLWTQTPEFMWWERKAMLAAHWIRWGMSRNVKGSTICVTSGCIGEVVCNQWAEFGTDLPRHHRSLHHMVNCTEGYCSLVYATKTSPHYGILLYTKQVPNRWAICPKCLYIKSRLSESLYKGGGTHFWIPKHNFHTRNGSHGETSLGRSRHTEDSLLYIYISWKYSGQAISRYGWSVHGSFQKVQKWGSAKFEADDCPQFCAYSETYPRLTARHDCVGA